MLQRYQRQASSDKAIGLSNRANVSLSSSDSATAIVCLQLKGTYTYMHLQGQNGYFYQYRIRNFEKYLQWIELENLVLPRKLY